MAVAAAAVVSSDFDPFSSEARRNPYATYERLRAASPLIRLANNDTWAVPRFAENKAVLENHPNYTSAGGAELANHSNKTPCPPPSCVREAAPPLHTRTRAVLARVLSPGVMRR